MEKIASQRSRYLIPFSKLYAIWFAIGYVLVVTDTLPSYLEWANAAYLMIAGGLSFLWLVSNIGLRGAVILALGTAVVSFGAEWFGVKTGLWFGQYEYGDSFAPFLFGVPLAIPFAWLAVLTMSAAFSSFARLSRTGFAALAALLAVAFDALLDPVSAAKLYWTWEPSDHLSLYQVPWTNFVSWWGTAFVIFMFFYPLWRRATDRIGTRFTWTNVPLLLALTLFLLFITLSVILQVTYALLWSVPVWILAIALHLTLGRRQS
jgi:putative membrane protein